MALSPTNLDPNSDSQSILSADVPIAVPALPIDPAAALNPQPQISTLSSDEFSRIVRNDIELRLRRRDISNGSVPPPYEVVRSSPITAGPGTTTSRKSETKRCSRCCSCSSATVDTLYIISGLVTVLLSIGTIALLAIGIPPAPAMQSQLSSIELVSFNVKPGTRNVTPDFALTESDLRAAFGPDNWPVFKPFYTELANSSNSFNYPVLTSVVIRLNSTVRSFSSLATPVEAGTIATRFPFSSITGFGSTLPFLLPAFNSNTTTLPLLITFNRTLSSFDVLPKDNILGPLFAGCGLLYGSAEMKTQNVSDTSRLTFGIELELPIPQMRTWSWLGLAPGWRLNRTVSIRCESGKWSEAMKRLGGS